MQRKLFIIRHGKSSWESVVDDIDRPLNERGVHSAYEMAGRLMEKQLIPDIIYSSPADRALHTAIIMARSWNTSDELIQIRYKLYLADSNDLLDFIPEIPDKYTSVALFGHNPGFTEFANRFLNEPIENIPTAGVLIVTLELASWTDIINFKLHDFYFDFPKNKS